MKINQFTYNLFYVIVFVFLLFVACSKKNDGPVPDEKINKIEFPNSEITLFIGQEDTLRVKHYPTNLAKPEYVWSNSNPDIITISKLGVFKAIKVGKSEIIATLKDSNLKAKLIVNVLPVLPDKLSLSMDNPNLFVGDSTKVNFSINPPNTTDLDNYIVEWSSSDSKILTVKNGLVKGHMEGKANVIGKLKGTNVSSEIEINVKPVLATSINFNIESGKVEVGQYLTIFSTINPINTTYKELVWTSSDNSIATVKDGVVTGLKEGEVTITAKNPSSSVTKSINVTIIPVKVKQIILNTYQLKLLVGGSFNIDATIVPTNAKDRSVTWKSSNPLIASIDQNGKITANAIGQTYITVTSDSDPTVSSSCEVQVVDLDYDIRAIKTTSSFVVINGYYTGPATFVLANYGLKTATVTKFEIKDGFGNVIYTKNEFQQVPGQMQRSYSINFNSNYSPTVYFHFEIDGKKFIRTIKVD